MLKNVTILLPFFTSLFWGILFLANRKQNSRSQNIWAVVTVLIMVTSAIIGYYRQPDKSYSLYYKLNILDCFVTLSYIPFIYLYFREVTGDQSWLGWKALLLFLPPVFVGAAVAFVFCAMGHEQATAFVKYMIENPGQMPDNELLFPYYHIYNIVNSYGYNYGLLLQTIVTIVYGFYRMLLFRRQLGDYYADIEGKLMTHHWRVLCMLLVLLVLVLIMIITGHLLFISYDVWVSVMSTLVGITLYYICYHISRSNYTTKHFTCELANCDSLVVEVFDEKDENSVEYTDSTHPELLIRFNRLIDEDKLFLQKNLRVSDVVSRLQTNRTYISQIIKEEYNCSFCQFINHKRIGYAKEQALLNPLLSGEALSEMCGFSHIAAFSRAFRECEKKSFREWRRQM